jgi:hypothetical protein
MSYKKRYQEVLEKDLQIISEKIAKLEEEKEMIQNKIHSQIITDIVSENGFCISFNYGEPIIGTISYDLKVHVHFSDYNGDKNQEEIEGMSDDQPDWVYLVAPDFNTRSLYKHSYVYGDVNSKNDFEYINKEDEYDEPQEYDKSTRCTLYLPKRDHLCDFYLNQTFETYNPNTEARQKWKWEGSLPTTSISDLKLNDCYQGFCKCSKLCDQGKIVNLKSNRTFEINKWLENQNRFIVYQKKSEF